MFAGLGPSISLGRVYEIPVKVHWSFSILILFIGYLAYLGRVPESERLWFFTSIFCLFLFVIMHELGHSLMGRYYGVKTRDIIIVPFGGIARLESLPERALHEMIVALAGPFVNLVLAVLIGAGLYITGNFEFDWYQIVKFTTGSDLVRSLFIMNVALVVFNLFPAFPMDGGRVLRSLLTILFDDREKATLWAMAVGSGLSVLMFGLGYYLGMIMLMIIALFVFLTARGELGQFRLSKKMNDTLVEEIMRKPSESLSISDTIEKADAIDDIDNFTVTDGVNGIVGVLPKQFVKEALKRGDDQATIDQYLSQAYGFVSAESNLKDAFHLMNDNGWALALINDSSGHIRGVIDRDMVVSFIKDKKKK